MAELPFRKRIYFGMGGLTMNLPDMIVAQWFFVRYAPAEVSQHLIPAALLGVVFFLGRMAEGTSNPFVGHFSDTCKHRWGRRLPFLRFGIVPFALVFFLLFNPPVGHMHWINIVYVLIISQAYFILYSAVITPYLALLPELTSDVKERVDLTTAQSVFLLIGTFIFVGVGPTIEHFGWAVMAAGVAVLMLIFFFPIAFLVQEKSRPAVQDEVPLHLLQSVRLAFKNRPFRYLLAGTGLYWFGLSGVIALIPFWAECVLGFGKGDVASLMGPFLVVNLVAFFVVNALVPRYGKYKLMQLTFLTSAPCLAALCLVGWFPVGSMFWQTAIIVGLFGVPVGGFMVLPFAILADIVDYDERQIGRRREAIFFGVQGIVQKLFIGSAMLTFTFVPYLGGGGSVTPFGLKLMALLCGIACLLGGIAFLGYPLREKGGKIIVLGE